MIDARWDTNFDSRVNYVNPYQWNGSVSRRRRGGSGNVATQQGQSSQPSALAEVAQQQLQSQQPERPPLMSSSPSRQRALEEAPVATTANDLSLGALGWIPGVSEGFSVLNQFGWDPTTSRSGRGVMTQQDYLRTAEARARGQEGDSAITAGEEGSLPALQSWFGSNPVTRLGDNVLNSWADPVGTMIQGEVLTRQAIDDSAAQQRSSGDWANSQRRSSGSMPYVDTAADMRQTAQDINNLTLGGIGSQLMRGEVPDVVGSAYRGGATGIDMLRRAASNSENPLLRYFGY